MSCGSALNLQRRWHRPAAAGVRNRVCTTRELGLDSPLTQLRGVGPKLAGRLAAIGLLLVRTC